MTKYLSAKTLTTVLSLLAATVSFSTQASVTPDRTRLIFNESDKSISVTLRNNDLIWRKAGLKMKRASRSARRWRYCRLYSALKQ